MQPSDLNLYPVWYFVCFPVIGTAIQFFQIPRFVQKLPAAKR